MFICNSACMHTLSLTVLVDGCGSNTLLLTVPDEALLQLIDAVHVTFMNSLLRNTLHHWTESHNIAASLTDSAWSTGVMHNWTDNYNFCDMKSLSGRGGGTIEALTRVPHKNMAWWDTWGTLQSVPDQFLSLRFQYTSVYIVTYGVIFWSGNLRIRNNRGLPGNRQSKYGGTENARLENAAPNCRTGRRVKRHAWKAKRCTSHVVGFNRISDTDERVLQCHSKR